jgi:16S rRNA processing protein RimM
VPAGAPAREITLERHWLHKGRVVLKFSGVDSIEAADRLRGLMVAIPAADRALLTDGSVYIADLMGCRVIDVEAGHTEIGTVADVDREAGLLVVSADDGSEVLIPFVQAYLDNIDIAGKRIEMRLPAGLLEINAPMSDEERRVVEQERRMARQERRVLPDPEH